MPGGPSVPGLNRLWCFVETWLEISCGEHFLGRRSIARAIDHPRGVEEHQLESESLVEINDSVCSLVREDDWSLVLGQPLGCPHLVFPSEALLRIAGEFYVVRWVSVDEVPSLQRNLLEVRASELPPRKLFAVRREILRVGDLRIPAEGHVEFTLTIET